MRLYDLGPTKWEDAVALSSALTALRREGIVLVRPQPPVLCVGDLVNLGRVVDSESCRAQGIPIVSSRSRTNALCVAQAELELRAVLPLDTFSLDEQETETYLVVLTPLLEACRDIGVEAELRVPNEIVAHGRRIASACKGRANRCAIISASLAVDFSSDSFATLLNAPDETLKSRMIELVKTRRSCLRQELPALPPVAALEQRICAHLRRLTGGLEPGVVDAPLRAEMNEQASRISASASRHGENGAASDWNVDVGGGTELQQRTCKAPGGLVRVSSEWHNRRLVNAMLGGDFLCYPPGRIQRLETALVGVSVGQVAAKVCEFYRLSGWVTPGIQPGHWTKALLPLSLEDYAPAAPHTRAQMKEG